MKNFMYLILVFLVMTLVSCKDTNDLTMYNVVWNSPSNDCLDSMPLSGRNGAGANVWVQNGSIWIYLGHSAAYDAQGRPLKLGCLRITPVDFELGISDFTQELDLNSGSIIISQDNFRASLWFADQSLIIETINKKPEKLKIAYGTWRDKDLKNILLELNSSKGDYTSDSVETTENGILWIHDNKTDEMDLEAWANCQGFAIEDVNDITSQRIMGGALAVEGGLNEITINNVQWQYWDGTAWEGETELSKEHLLVATLGAGLKLNPQDWMAQSQKLLNKNVLTQAKKEEEKKWHEFWNRSYVKVQKGKDKNDEGFKIGQNYQLFRYMMACNRGAELPQLFNGGIFTVDNISGRITGNNNNELPTYLDGKYTPDYRRWMTCHFMSQNQRWLGRPAIANGDADLLEPTTKFYRERAMTAASRAKINGAEGVVYTEPLDIWGLCCVAPLPNGLCGSEHLTYHFSMGLDEAWMALEGLDVLGKPIDEDLDWIIGTVEFYDSYYRAQNLARNGQELDEEGKLVLYPTNAVEHAGDATNSVDAVCGLTRVTDALLQLKNLPSDKREKLTVIRNSIPEMPVGERGGKMSILPAKSFGWEYNLWEPTELIAAYPYRMAGVTKPETMQLLRDTYQTIPDNRKDFCNKDYSWMPNVANAALMADPEFAEQRAIYKLANTEAPQSRFPAFFGPGHDWIPDMNWGGSGMVGLQQMLLAADPYGDGKIYLLHAWPKKWDVDFKLYAPQKTVIEASVKDGKVVALQVSPESRKQDIIVDARFN